MGKLLSALSVFALDDNQADVKMIKRYLEDSSVPWDLEFNYCLDPEDGLDYLSEHDVDLVFLDYEFPHSDGLTVLKRLRKNGQDMPVILLTGKGDQTIALEAYESGVKGYLSKDQVDEDVLREAIDNALVDDYLWEDVAPDRIERSPDSQYE